MDIILSPRITAVSTVTLSSSVELPTEMPILFNKNLYWIHSGSDYIYSCFYNTANNSVEFNTPQPCFYNNYAPTVAVDNTISR